jgi:hypothetical protein
MIYYRAIIAIGSILALMALASQPKPAPRMALLSECPLTKAVVWTGDLDRPFDCITR